MAIFNILLNFPRGFRARSCVVALILCLKTSDPLSLTGTAVGIVLLGLQVCTGIIQYHHQWNIVWESTWTNVECLLKQIKSNLTKVRGDKQEH
jgi:hypothetical protein